MRQVVLDTETTGLNIEQGHRIIEIGCVELINRKLTGRHYHQYINPERKIDEEAGTVHGITDQSLIDKPRFSHIAAEFMEFIKDAELIIHNASFDIGFIDYELGLTNAKWKPITEYCKVIDTLALARQLHAGQRNSLDALCKRYGIDNSQRELHGALLDANLLAYVYLAMTGGQGTLFDEVASINPVSLTINQKSSIVTPSVPRKLCVIKADNDELALHEQQLKKMAEKKKCLWLEQ